MTTYVGDKFGDKDVEKLVSVIFNQRIDYQSILLFTRCLLASQKDFEKRVDPNDKNAQTLLEEMRQHIKKV